MNFCLTFVIFALFSPSMRLYWLRFYGFRSDDDSDRAGKTGVAAPPTFRFRAKNDSDRARKLVTAAPPTGLDDAAPPIGLNDAAPSIAVISNSETTSEMKAPSADSGRCNAAFTTYL